MDVLTDTKMPDRCTDASQKTPRHGVYMCPPSPNDMGNIWYRENIQMYRGYGDIQMSGGIQTYGGNMDTLKPDNLLCLPLMWGNILFKAKFLHLKSCKIIREPPDCTGKKPTLDIPTGGSGHDIKIK